MSSLRVVYLGNLECVVDALQKRPDVDLCGWIQESEDVFREAHPQAHLCQRVSSNNELTQHLERLRPFHLGVIANFGLILSSAQLASAGRGFINAHLGLLPENRGRYPIKRVIRERAVTTGVTLHWATPEVDAGPIIAMRRIALGQNPQHHEIFERLSSWTVDLVNQYLPSVVQLEETLTA